MMALFLLHVVFADVVRDYWQNDAPHFAHLDYDHFAKLTKAPQTNLSGEAALIQRWKSVWLTPGAPWFLARRSYLRPGPTALHRYRAPRREDKSDTEETACNEQACRIMCVSSMSCLCVSVNDLSRPDGLMGKSLSSSNYHGNLLALQGAT